MKTIVHYQYLNGSKHSHSTESKYVEWTSVDHFVVSLERVLYLSTLCTAANYRVHLTTLKMLLQ